MKISKKAKNICCIILCLIIVMILLSSTVQAFEMKDLTGTKLSSTNAKDIGNQIITILSVVGSVVSVITLIIIGIKYMTGSVEEKAEYKKTLAPYIIGAGLVFAASGIAGIIYGFAINIG